MSWRLSSTNLAVYVNKRHLSPSLLFRLAPPLSSWIVSSLCQGSPPSACCTVAPNPCWNLITTALFNWNGIDERGQEGDNRACFIWSPFLSFLSHSLLLLLPLQGTDGIFFINVSACFFLLWWIESKEALRLFQITEGVWKGGQGYRENVRIWEILRSRHSII